MEECKSCQLEINESREAQCIHCGKIVPSNENLPGFVATPPEKKKYDQFVCCLGI